MASPTVKIEIDKEEPGDDWTMFFTIDYGFAKFTHFINDASLCSLKSWNRLAEGKKAREAGGV